MWKRGEPFNDHRHHASEGHPTSARPDRVQGHEVLDHRPALGPQHPRLHLGAEEAQRVGGGARVRAQLQDRGARQPGHRGARSGVRGRYLPSAERCRRVVRNFEAKIPGGPGGVRGRALRGGTGPGTGSGGAGTDRTRTQVRSRGGDD